MTSEADRPGFSSGVAQAVDAAGPLLPLRDAEQLDLLHEEAGSGELSAHHVQLAPRGRGRPKGAVNQRSAKIRDWLLSKYAHPLEVLAQTYSRPVDHLARELGCTKHEAAKLQVQAAAELAPYIEGKQPVSIDVTNRQDVVLIVPGLNTPAGMGADEVLDLVSTEGLHILENQEVSE